MVRVFYIVLYAATIAAGAAHWARWKGTDVPLVNLGARVARAQQPQFNSNYSTQPAGYVPGIPPSSSSLQIPPSANSAPPMTRPDAWPTNAPLFAGPSSPPGSQEFDPAQSVPLEDTRILARVGSVDVVLAVEILPSVNELLARNAAQIPPDKLEMVRTQLIRQRLEQAIQTKCLLAEVRAKVPEEAFKNISEKMREQFDKQEVPKAMAQLGLSSPAELDAKLHKTGGSLDRERRAFVERTMAISWVQQHVKKEAAEFTPDEMLAYYNEHAAEFQLEGKARWQQLTVRFDRSASKEDAYRQIAEAGNQILAGADFAEVARRVSQGPTAASGGMHDWTRKDSLVSTVLDGAIFSQPVGQMSPILEDAVGFHIVRVLERQEPGRKSFPEAQAEIRVKLDEGRHDKAIEKYVMEVRGRTRITTIFDAPGSEMRPTGPQDLPINPYVELGSR